MHDVAVVGGGCAGASAAIYLAKAGLKTLVLDNDKGQTRRAWMPNYLGFAKGLAGPELVDDGRRHAVALGADWETTQVKDVTRGAEGFSLTTEDGQTYEAKQVILATGAALALAEAMNLEFTEGREARYPKVLKVDVDGRTNEPGVWAAGILAGRSPHAIVTAGHGAEVAIGLISEQQGKRYIQHEAMK
jgi:thioredoxin reductase (NADPH)